MKGGNPKLASMLHYTDTDGAIEEITKAFKATGGNIVATAAKLKIGRRTLFRWCSEYPALAKALEDARENQMEA